MAIPNYGGDVIRFGAFEFNRYTLELRRAGHVVKLAPQPGRLLQALVDRPGRLVTRAELHEALWSRDTFVDFDAGLNYCLGRLRVLLGDRAQHPRFIETIARRGYRFVAPVERAGGRQPTLAVLPFDNLGGDPGEEYLSDGVTDGLITELGKIPSLRVISRQSVLHFKGSQLALGDIARQLRADALVEGTVLRHGDRLRVTAQLVEADPERHLWAEGYEGEPREFLDLLARVARAVAGAISHALAPEDAPRLAAEPPAKSTRPDHRAETAYLQARFHLGKLSGEGIQRGLMHLQEAIALDPTHARAHAALANCLVMLGYWGHAPWQEAYRSAKQAALKAVELDPGLCYGQVALAFVRLLYDWDFDRAEVDVQRAVGMGPSDEMAHLLKAAYESWIRDDQDAAITSARTALAIDPISPYTNSNVAWVLMFARRYDEAAEQAQRTLEMYQDAHQALLVLAWARVARGCVDEALTMFERAAAASPDPVTLGFLGHVQGRMGRETQARALLERLTAGSESTSAPVKSIVSVLTGLGETDRAFEWLERGLAVRDGGLLALRVSPPLEPLATDPRFDRLVERIGLKAATRPTCPTSPARPT